jgi:hypothetical protein
MTFGLFPIGMYEHTSKTNEYLFQKSKNQTQKKVPQLKPETLWKESKKKLHKIEVVKLFKFTHTQNGSI